MQVRIWLACKLLKARSLQQIAYAVFRFSRKQYIRKHNDRYVTRLISACIQNIVFCNIFSVRSLRAAVHHLNTLVRLFRTHNNVKLHKAAVKIENENNDLKFNFKTHQLIITSRQGKINCANCALHRCSLRRTYINYHWHSREKKLSPYHTRAYRACTRIYLTHTTIFPNPSVRKKRTKREQKSPHTGEKKAKR